MTANGTAVLLRLAPYCVHNIADQLTVAGPTRITLIGGPATTIQHDPAAPGSRLFSEPPRAPWDRQRR